MLRKLTFVLRQGISLLPKTIPVLVMPTLILAPRLSRPIFMTTTYYLQRTLTRPIKAIETQQTFANSNSLVKLPEKSLSLWQRFTQVLASTLRFFHLLIIFAPAILTLPLKFMESTKDYWIDIFVECVARAGVVWIKAFQYLSHRRDMIGEDMARKFVKLRQNAPQHSLQQTNQSFRREFGKNIAEIFDQFDPVPIASASVSQVYQATYKGQKVAVKVRHPGVDKYIQRDINLLFFISRTFSHFSRRFQIPVGEESLKKTLTQQIDFNNQARNLRVFNQMFKNNKKVNFPTAYQQSTSSAVLVESFVEGKPITYYQQQKTTLNRVIARIGVTTFFQMLMKHNFIHADCHGGNILVRIKQQSTDAIDDLKYFFKGIYKWMEMKLVTWSFKSKLFRKLYLESRQEDEEDYKLEKQLNKKVEVTLIDVGMVIEMEEKDRSNFINFIKSFILQEPDDCAQMIYSLSLYKGKKIIEEAAQKYQKYHQDLKNLFSEIKIKRFGQIDGVVLFKKMLDLIRNSEMKLDGQFATLLTNMLVLEAIAKDLHPEINILKCAIPYFKTI